jgi:hypothetical protein
MANFDTRYDTLPANPMTKPRGPSITNLRSALTTHNATSYSDSRLAAMSKNDMIYACVVHNLTVAGL